MKYFYGFFFYSDVALFQVGLIRRKKTKEVSKFLLFDKKDIFLIFSPLFFLIVFTPPRLKTI